MCRKGSVTEKKNGRNSQHQIDAGEGKEKGIGENFDLKSLFSLKTR